MNTHELAARKFKFGRVDGSMIGILTLEPDGTISGYQNYNEKFWSAYDDKILFLNEKREVTTIFNEVVRKNPTYVLKGEFVPRGKGAWHTLTEVLEPKRDGIVGELLEALYGGDGPLSHTDPRYKDDGYPHTNLIPDVIRSVMEVIQPKFWLELGSMLGGSAIRVGDIVKANALETEIVCVDPFTGDVNMWAWEQPKKMANEWLFLHLERGKPTIYDRFLANVTAAGHADIILPIMATSIVGLKLLRRLAGEHRISSLPSVIYLDSAHEPNETFLELQNCWDLLAPGGILMGDDWNWDAVRNDVVRFAKTIAIDPDRRQRLADQHQLFTEQDGILSDRGQWVLVK